MASRSRVEESACISINSIYGQFQKELWGLYDVVFVDAGYSHGTDSLVLPEEHFKAFMNKNFDENGLIGVKDLLGLSCYDAETQGVRFASDNKGAAIKYQAVEYMKHEYKISYIENLFDIVKEYEELETEEKDYKNENSGLYDCINSENSSESIELKELKKISEEAVMEEQEPSLHVTLGLVYDSLDQLSHEQLDEETLLSNRELNKGTIPSLFEESYSNKILFREYLLRHADSLLRCENDVGIKYETEYLLYGQDSDLDNLEKAFNKILLIREANNISSLSRDSARMQKIVVLSNTLALLIETPEAGEAIKKLIIALWSYVESVNDLKLLTNGKSVPFIKTPSQWKTSILGITVNNQNSIEKDEEKSGMKYEDYLRLLLYLTSDNKLIERFMNIVEINIKTITDNSFFRLDYCFDAWTVEAYVTGKDDKTYKIARTKDIEK